MFQTAESREYSKIPLTLKMATKWVLHFLAEYTYV